MRTTNSFIYLAFTVIALGSLTLAPQARATCDQGCDIPNSNTFFGNFALHRNTTGVGNTAIGPDTLSQNSTGRDNTAMGPSSLANNDTGRYNTAIGSATLYVNESGNDNTATGVLALFANSGSDNTATGSAALTTSTTGNGNTADGSRALHDNKTGERNTAIGFNSLQYNVSGSFNVAVGAGAGRSVSTANDVICIGRGIDGANVSNTCFIGNIRGVTTRKANALPVVIDEDGQLGTMSSSERFKKDIVTMDKASEGILSLRPVTFHYNIDDRNIPQFGLIAEEVAKVNPALVLPDKEGKPYTVRYDAVNAMLLNEFLKEHHKAEEQRRNFEAALAKQQKQIEALTAAMQKVSAQLEVSKVAPQTVLNDQ
jgi:hypothetical protein